MCARKRSQPVVCFSPSLLWPTIICNMLFSFVRAPNSDDICIGCYGFHCCVSTWASARRTQDSARLASLSHDAIKNTRRPQMVSLHGPTRRMILMLLPLLLPLCQSVSLMAEKCAHSGPQVDRAHPVYLSPQPPVKSTLHKGCSLFLPK